MSGSATVTLSSLVGNGLIWTPTANAGAGSIAAAVVSVAGRTGAVSLTHNDITDWSSATAAGAGVASFNGRTGAVGLISSDVTAALGFAPVNPSSLAPVATSGTLTIASVTGLSAALSSAGQWSAGAVSAISGGTINGGTLAVTGAVASVAGRTGAITLAHGDLTDWTLATAGFLTSQQWTAGPVGAVSGGSIASGTLTIPTVTSLPATSITGLNAAIAAASVSEAAFAAVALTASGTLAPASYASAIEVQGTFATSPTLTIPANFAATFENALTGAAAFSSPYLGSAFNSTDSGASLALSNGNLTATSSNVAGNWVAVRVSAFASSGQIYFEALTNNGISGPPQTGVGLASALEPLTLNGSVQGWDSHAITWVNGSVLFGSSTPRAIGIGSGSSQRLGIAADITNGLFWVTPNGTSWNGGAGNPAAGTGGISFAAMTERLTTGVAIMALFYGNAGSVTINTGASAFAYTVPAGFQGTATPPALIVSNGTGTVSIAPYSAAEIYASPNGIKNLSTGAVSSVAGRTGAVTLGTADISGLASALSAAAQWTAGAVSAVSGGTISGGTLTIAGSGTGVPAPGTANISTTLSATGLVTITDQTSGAVSFISPANFATGDGTTLPAYAAANPGTPGGTDSLLAVQGSAVVAYSLSSIATFAQTAWTGGVAAPVVISSTAGFPLDFTAHNRRLLVFTAAGTLNPPASFATIGSGFSCEVLAQGGAITLGSGITTSSGAQTVPDNTLAQIRAYTASGNNVIWCQMPGSAAAASPYAISFGATSPATPTATVASPNVAVTVNGTMTGYTSTPGGLTYQIDGGSAVLVPAGSVTGSASPYALSFALGSTLAAGTHTVWIGDSNTPQTTATLTLGVLGASLSGSLPSTGTQGQPVTLGVTASLLGGLATAYACFGVSGGADVGTRAAFSGALPATLTLAGSGTLNLRVYDAATGGNLLAQTSSTITVAAAPTIILTGVASNQTAGGSLSVPFTYANYTPTSAAYTWTATSGGSSVGSTAATGFTASAGSGSMTVALPSTAGTYTLGVTATGSSTSASATQAGIVVAVPAISVTAPTATVYPGQTLALSGTFAGNPPSQIDVEFDAAGFTITAVPITVTGSTWTTTTGVTAPSAGSHTVTVRETAATSVVSASSAAFTVSAPSITVNTPTGTINAGSTMTLAGSFTGSAPSQIDVQFDTAGFTQTAVPVTITGSAWATTGTITAPSGGSHTVTVRETAATSVVSAASGSFTVAAVNPYTVTQSTGSSPLLTGQSVAALATIWPNGLWLTISGGTPTSVASYWSTSNTSIVTGGVYDAGPLSMGKYNAFWVSGNGGGGAYLAPNGAHGTTWYPWITITDGSGSYNVLLSGNIVIS